MSASRRDRIRTCDPCVPNTVLYQAEPRTVILFFIFGRALRAPFLTLVPHYNIAKIYVNAIGA